MFKGNLSSLRVAVIIFAVLTLGAGAVAVRNAQEPSQVPPPAGTVDLDITPVPGQTRGISILYASQDIGVTKVWQVDSISKDIGLVASLPDKIKHINYFPPDSFIFISDTNTQDHGKYIKRYNINTKTEEVLATASPQWGIDDVVISPDGTYIAWWEVKLSDEQILLNGLSRVYLKKLGETTAYLLANEISTQTAPIHYPLFFGGDNRLYLDSFIPNGGGYNLGLFVYDPNAPSVLNPVAGMNDGDFVTDPILSPDGTKILFASYDENAPIQNASDGTGVNRLAILNPNQITVMDLSTGAKTILADSSNNSQYANPLWSDDGSFVVYQKFTLTDPDTSDSSGVFQIESTGGAPLPLQVPGLSSLNLLRVLDNQLIWGEKTVDVGNLGPKYANILSLINSTNLTLMNTDNIIVLPNLQYIFATTDQLPVITLVNYNTVKLGAFSVSVVPEARRVQQNDPPGGFPVIDDKLIRKFNTWVQTHPPKNYDSPLYLYPTKETFVTVQTPGTVIFADTPSQTNNTWQVTAYPDGRIIASGQEYRKISYSYLSQTNIPAPKQGLVAERENLEGTLSFFAQNLSLEAREVEDFVAFWKKQLPDSPYYFMAAYSPEDAKTILPLEIIPSPDTLLQIVVYFKPLTLPIFTLPPVFERVERSGFVVVDWSGNIDR